MAKTESISSENSTNVQSYNALARWRRGLGLAEQVSVDLAARMAAELFLSTQRRPRPQRELELLARAEPLALGAGAVGHSFGDGPAVLLAHGWGGRGAQLGAFVEPLVQSGYRVVMYDAKGHGDAEGRRATLLDFADAARRVGWQVGPLHAIIAHSFGGPGVCLALSRGLSARGALFLAPPAYIERGLRNFAEALELSPRITTLMKRSIERSVGVGFEDIEPLTLAARMTTPLLVIHDRDDAEVPYSDGLALAQAWPGAVFHATQGLGHRKILWSPQVVEAAVGFVSGLEREPRRDLDRYFDEAMQRGSRASGAAS